MSAVLTSPLLGDLQIQARAEGVALLSWWSAHSVDEARGGFYGEIDADDTPVTDAPKSLILNARLLWFFSAMARWLNDEGAWRLAHRAAAYIKDRFRDRDHGGFYWLLDSRGQVVDPKKQAYGQAFVVYAFAEFARATGDKGALALARETQREIEERFWERGHGGYLEALSPYWTGATDQRLSDKDLDAPKTMNTHLHILEAYTNLHRSAPDEVTHAALYRVLDVFLEHFANAKHDRLNLFFDMDWTDRTTAISFGHDIEASWLIEEAAEALRDRDLLARARPVVLGLAEATLRGGLNPAGGLNYERTFSGHTDTAGEWWGQAEALVGFVNAWQMTGENAYLDATQRLWTYMRQEFGVGAGGEWTWYGRTSGRPPAYKAGLWKCPYHSGRAMIELDRRLNPPTD